MFDEWWPRRVVRVGCDYLGMIRSIAESGFGIEFAAAQWLKITYVWLAWWARPALRAADAAQLDDVVDCHVVAMATNSIAKV